MKAIRILENNGKMCYEDIPKPSINDGGALIKNEAIGINFIDIYYKKGLYPASPPFTLGIEASGIIQEIGKNVKGLKTGDRVAYNGVMGSYAEYASVPAEKIIILPEGINSKTAAASLLQGMTAHYLSHDAYPLKPESSCLIHAASGGVGLLLVQMAKLKGAYVIGTVSTSEKEKLPKEFGADQIVSYEDNWGKVDVVYDSVGKDTFEKSLDSLNKKGMMVLFGSSSGPVQLIDIKMLNDKGSLFLTRPSLKDYTLTKEELLYRANEVFSMILSKQLKITIGKEYKLQDAEKAHSDLQSRKTTGKLLLIP